MVYLHKMEQNLYYKNKDITLEVKKMLQGTYVALITLFKNGSIDWTALKILSSFIWKMEQPVFCY
jgi:hypothetical protein